MACADNFIIIDSHYGTYVKIFSDFTDLGETRTPEEIAAEVFRCAAYTICFDDCSDDDEIKAIYVNGREVKYKGWQPGMLYEFYDASTKEIVYSHRFPEWDH